MLKILRNIGILAASVVFLAGCTGFNKNQDNSTPSNDTSKSQAATETSDTAQEKSGVTDTSKKIDSVSTNTNQSASDENKGQKLTKPNLGFILYYPGEFTLNESVSCAEGCPTGEEVPFLDFIGAGSHVAMEAYGSEIRAIRYLGSGSNVAAFMASGTPQQVKRQTVTGGMRYDFVMPGRAANGIAPAKPAQRYVFFIRSNGQTFGLSTPQDAGADGALRQIADSFEFI